MSTISNITNYSLIQELTEEKLNFNKTGYSKYRFIDKNRKLSKKETYT